MKIYRKITAVTYTLELNAEEAQFLQDVLFQVGGSPTKSRRCIADGLRQVLQDVGVRCSRKAADIRLMHSGVYFVNMEETE